MKKTLSVYRTEKGIIVERKSELGLSSEKSFETEKAMLEHLDEYKKQGEIENYELNVSNEFWSLIINHLNS